MALPLPLPEAAAVLAALLLLLVCMIAHLTARKMPTLHRHEEEKFFVNAEGRKEPVPSIHDPPTRELSVVVPSYNEEDRLPLMMDEALNYLEKRQKRDPSFTYEVIVVDDGSKDQTTKGVFSSRGKKILMADADGATKFEDIEKVEEGLKNLQPWPNQMAISCGSRAHLEKDSIAKAVVDKAQAWNLYCNRRIAGLIFSASLDVLIMLNVLKMVHLHQKNQRIHTGSTINLGLEHFSEKHKRSYFRTLLMYGFHFLVWFLCVKEIRDTQCGFKLLTREAALRTFSTLHIERWAFDVELLYIAQHLRIPIAEVAVNWTEIEGSKLVPFWSWLQMGRDLLFIRLRYMTGAWQLETRKCN
ncbi:dolichyl-phosphate beta-glucosyltransferase isoform X2 [Accipiter gentilis]|uniref:dolichyl-phosphate beta-glucosyltransferase isoform X2 n=1 Tax=Astur gentilis TaxID=8957 RepID=UPI00210FD5F8|nr:dolichyl-phosphate beta-glucosyltransferase isoform X2 [Accipiter gentilis]